MKKVTLALIAMGFSLAASQAVMASGVDDLTITVGDITAQSVADVTNEIDLPDADDVNEISDDVNEADDDAADAEDDADEADDDADEAEEDGSDANDDADEVDEVDEVDASLVN